MPRMTKSSGYLTAYVPAWKWEMASRGVECAFISFMGPSVPYLATMGLKVYPAKSTAEIAATRQARAHKINLAPQCFGICKVEIEGLKKHRYGVLTERAIPFHKDGSGIIGSSPGSNAKAYSDLEQLLEGGALQAINLEYGDLGEKNVGWVKFPDGKTRLVPIDWGPAGTTVHRDER